MRTSKRNNRGFTLIEIMVAMVITLVALMGLLEAMAIVGDRNLGNQQRDEAVQIAEEQMNLFRTVPVSEILTTYPVLDVPSKLRGGKGTYKVTRTTAVSTDGDQIDIGVNVQWTYKNKTYSHEVHTVRGNSIF